MAYAFLPGNELAWKRFNRSKKSSMRERLQFYVDIIPITVGVERLVVAPVVAAVDAVVAVVGAWVVGVWVVGAWVVGVGVAAVGAVAEAAGKSTNGVTHKIQ